MALLVRQDALQETLYGTLSDEGSFIVHVFIDHIVTIEARSITTSLLHITIEVLDLMVSRPFTLTQQNY